MKIGNPFGVIAALILPLFLSGCFGLCATGGCGYSKSHGPRGSVVSDAYSMCRKTPTKEITYDEQILEVCIPGDRWKGVSATIKEREEFGQLKEASVSLVCLARIKGQSQYERDAKAYPVTKSCTIKDGEASVTEIRYANPFRAFLECKSALRERGHPEGLVRKKMALLDYQIDNEVAHDYTLELAVSYGKIDKERPVIKKGKRESFSTTGIVFHQAKCVVRSGSAQHVQTSYVGEIETLKYYNYDDHFSGTLTWNDIATLEYKGLISNSGWRVGADKVPFSKKRFFEGASQVYSSKIVAWPEQLN